LSPTPLIRAVGWATLGGPRTQGQARSSTYVNVQSKTVVY